MYQSLYKGDPEEPTSGMVSLPTVPAVTSLIHPPPLKELTTPYSSR